MRHQPHLLLLSDFNLDNFRAYLETKEDAPCVSTRTAPYGQVLQALLDPDHEVWHETYDGIVLWTRPQSVSPAFSDALRGRSPRAEAVLREVGDFAKLVLELKNRTGAVFLPTWVLAPCLRGSRMARFRRDGLARLLLESNLLLARRFDEHPQIMLLDTQSWIEAAGADPYDPRYWYAAKVPFSPSVFDHATTEIKAVLASLTGQARKLVIVDLDDTLWGGVIGDDGLSGIKLGGHDPVGEAFVDFQEGLAALVRRGVLLAIVSKNEAAVALEAISRHPEMRLRLEDFVAWRINWEDKASNILELVNELNIGLQSVVFLDDNPAERSRVREALPEVLVPELPNQKMYLPRTLRSLTCFDTPCTNQEDLERTQMYAVERKRAADRARIASLDDWLRSLELQATVEGLKDGNIKRAVQLLNKTNQMNLTTRRLTETELRSWLDAGDRALWTLRVQDRFGDTGLVGIVSVDCGVEEVRIVDFVLSCRLFGRHIERLMISVAVDHARVHRRRSVCAKYVYTYKNAPMLRFLDESGFVQADCHLYVWDASLPYSAPDFITVLGNDGP